MTKLEIASADSLVITDLQISNLLRVVYVGGGFTQEKEATHLFEPAAVRERGGMICARDPSNSKLAGMVIVVFPGSPACRLAKHDEVEMHLLAVDTEYRRRGVGEKLVLEAINQAQQSGFKRMILWTQSTMRAAQGLYSSMGFVKVDQFEKNGRVFFLYNRSL